MVSAQGATSDFALDTVSLNASLGAPPPPPSPAPTPIRTATATTTRTATATATPPPASAPTSTSTPVPPPVGGGSITFVGAGPLFDSSAAVSTVVVGLPTGVQAGDTLVAQIIVYDGTASDAPNPPSGWTAIRHDAVNSGNKATSWLYYRIAGSNEPSSYSWSIIPNWAAGTMGAWRGASNTPVNKSSGATAASASISLAAPSMVPASNNEQQIYFYGAQSSSAPSIGLPNGLNLRFDSRSSKEGFTLAFADAGAPAVGVSTSSYLATSGSAAMTAQAILLFSSSGGTPNSPPPPPPPSQPTATPTPSAHGAIAFVGTGALADYSGPTTAVTLGMPSGIQAGDTLIAEVVLYDGNGTQTPSSPGGWNSIRHDSISDGNRITSWLFYRVASSSEHSIIYLGDELELGCGRDGRVARGLQFADR